MDENITVELFCKRYSASYEHALQISNYAKLEKIKKNDFIIKQDTINDKMYVVNEGMVRGVRFAGTHETTIWFATKGQAFCCPKSFAKREKAAITVQAISDCSVYSMSREEIDDLNSKYPNLKNICLNVFKELVIGVINFRFVILDHLNSTERYLAFCKLRPEIYYKIPLKYVSSYLGIAQQSLSRIRKSLKKQGIVQ